MGYTQYLREDNLHITEGKIKELQDYISRLKAGQLPKPRYIDPKEIKIDDAPHTISFCRDRWILEIDDSIGDVVLYFNGSNAFPDEDDEVMAILGKFAENRSYVEMEGEDDNLWRWAMSRGMSAMVFAKTVWPKPVFPEPEMHFVKGAYLPVITND